MNRNEMRKLGVWVLAMVMTSVTTMAQFDGLYASDDVEVTSYNDYAPDYTDTDDYASYDEYDDYDAYDGGEVETRSTYNTSYANTNYSKRINRFRRGGSFNYNSVVFVPTNRWGGGFGFNDPWCDPFDPWCNSAFNNVGGTNVFITVGNNPWRANRWNNFNRWNRWDPWGNRFNNRWGGNAWGGNAWGGNAWGANSWGANSWGANSWNGAGSAYACPGGVGWTGNRVSAISTRPSGNVKGTYNGSRRGGSTISSSNGRRTDRVGSTGSTLSRSSATRSGTRATNGTSRTRTNRGATRSGTIDNSNRSSTPVYSRERRSTRSSRDIRSGSSRSNSGIRSSRGSSRSNINSGSSRSNRSFNSRSRRSSPRMSTRSSSSRSSGSRSSSRGSSRRPR